MAPGAQLWLGERAELLCWVLGCSAPRVRVRVKAAVLRKEESMSSLRKQYEVSEGPPPCPGCGCAWAEH